MTPREYAREKAAAKQIAIGEQQRDAALAWTTAHYVAAARAGKLPPLKPILDRIGGPRGWQTVEEMKAQILILSAKTGFPVHYLKVKES